jgi:hypothetical protein
MSEGALSAGDAAAFGQVVQAFVDARAGRPAGQRELTDLQRLVADWGADAVQKAVDEVAASGVPLSSVGQVAALLEQDDPVLRQVVRLYVEEVAPHQRITPRVRDLLVAMKCEFPETQQWQEAVSRAVAANRRSLASVDALLRRHRDTGSWDAAPRQRKRDHGRSKESTRGPASRETKYPEAAGGQQSAAEGAGEKWKVPEGLF